jgi:hypothetical protein
VHPFVPDGRAGHCAVAVAHPKGGTKRFKHADREFEQGASHLVTFYDKVTAKEDQAGVIKRRPKCCSKSIPMLWTTADHHSD